MSYSVSLRAPLQLNKQKKKSCNILSVIWCHCYLSPWLLYFCTVLICWRYFGIKLLFILKCEVFVFTVTCTSWSCCVAAHTLNALSESLCVRFAVFSAGKNSLRTLPTLRWPFLLGRPQKKKKKKNDLWFFFSLFTTSLFLPTQWGRFSSFFSSKPPLIWP